MKIKAIKETKSPGYPTIDLHISNTEILNERIPSTWINNKIIVGALSTFVLFSSCNKEPKEKNTTSNDTSSNITEQQFFDSIMSLPLMGVINPFPLHDSINDYRSGSFSNKTTDIKGVELTQYTRTTLKNPYNEPLKIMGNGKTLATIPPGGFAVVAVNGEQSITFKVGKSSDVKPTKEKRAPKIEIIKTIKDGPDASLKWVQSQFGYRMEIVYGFPGDLEVSITGPVIIDKKSLVTYDIKLQMLNSQTAFDSWAKGKNEPYEISFTVTVKDKYNPKLRDSQTKTFTFGKW